MADGDLTAAVKRLALEAGFHRVGVAPAGPVPRAEAFDAWLSRGWHAGMAYMARNREKRRRPDRLVAGARSVICLAVSYAPADEAAPAAADDPRAFIARYARGRDYHKLLKQRCRRLIERIRRLAPRFEGRAFVDSAPVMERGLAAAAGVGWIGRNGMLIVPGLGSYVVLAEIVCSLPLRADGPLEGGCGDCGRCVAACPTGAIMADGLVDARRCLSYLTVECRGPVGRAYWPAVGRRLFGCDTCQEACPHNRGVPAGDEALRAAAPPALADVLAWSEADWDAATRGSAVRRATYEMLLRNACLAAGNTGDESLRPPLEALRQRVPRLAEEADWALARLGGR
jgi:epoxyqueuosine reductase